LKSWRQMPRQKTSPPRERPPWLVRQVCHRTGGVHLRATLEPRRVFCFPADEEPQATPPAAHQTLSGHQAATLAMSVQTVSESAGLGSRPHCKSLSATTAPACDMMATLPPKPRGLLAAGARGHTTWWWWSIISHVSRSPPLSPVSSLNSRQFIRIARRCWLAV
jgi:hypothetical protein